MQFVLPSWRIFRWNFDGASEESWSRNATTTEDDADDEDDEEDADVYRAFQQVKFEGIIFISISLRKL